MSTVTKKHTVGARELVKKRKGSIFDALSLSAQTFCSQINTFQDKSQKLVFGRARQSPREYHF